MDKKVMYVTSVIDTKLWDEACWMGTAILSDGSSAPYLGLVFQNRNAAIKIFEQWNNTFGHKDIYDEIRISVIEGEIPNQEHGYTIHITTSKENLLKKSLSMNLPITETVFALISRFRRMPTEKGNRSMSIFKEEFEKFLSYKVIPIHINDDCLEPLFDYEIEKTEIFFRQASEISNGDIDMACLK